MDFPSEPVVELTYIAGLAASWRAKCVVLLGKPVRYRVHRSLTKKGA